MNKYKWRTSLNNGNGAWGFQWKGGHDEWKTKQGKKSYIRFSSPSNNAIIYCSYLMTTSQEYLPTSTMTHNNNKYKWRTSLNNGNGAWGFQWKGGHDEWKTKQGKKSYIRFSNPSNNAIIYCSYLMTTSQESTEE